MSRIGLPNIDIVFKQKAVTAVQRSERGVLCVIVKDSKQTQGYEKFTFVRASQITSELFSDATVTALKRAFLVAVNKVIVFRCAGAVEPDEVVQALEGTTFNYICTTDKNYQQGLASWVKTYNAKSKGHKCVAVVSNVTTADSMYVVNVKGTGGVDADTGEDITAEAYTVRIASTLANLPMNRSVTNYEFTDLKSWDNSYITADKTWDDWIDEGWFTMVTEDDSVHCGRGVNSLVTFTSTETEDMSHIIIRESMNMILEDIYTTFKDYYVGKYKNTYDNQKLFISSINSYFRTLAGEEVLESTYDNHAEVDVEAQRNKWTSIGKDEALDWDDNKVRHMPFRTFVILAGDIKIVDAIEDLSFTISLS